MNKADGLFNILLIRADIHAEETGVGQQVHERIHRVGEPELLPDGLVQARTHSFSQKRIEDEQRIPVAMVDAIRQRAERRMRLFDGTTVHL